ncbi:MAG: PEP-CTERM sorting domain-containing protein [Methylophilaceae bacterium]
MTRIKQITLAVAAVLAANAGFASAAQGPSSSQTPYVTAVAPGVQFTSILTTGDSVGGYRMGGIPDGLGAYDNGNGTMTVLMNHELGATVGINRAHGAKGAYVSEWVIDKTTLQVQSGSDLMRTVKNTDGSAYTGALTFARFCSADLPAVSAFYNPTTGLGTQNRIFMNGEESGTGVLGAVGNRALAHVATGADKGTSYYLSAFGAASWENVAANGYAQDKTIVVGQSDGTARVGSSNVSGAVAVYVGNKTNVGNDAERAGLANGTTYYVNVSGMTQERVNSTTINTIAPNATFTLSTNAATSFSRPEDGAWDTQSNNKYYFVTTDQLDTVNDGVGTAVGRSRLYSMTFNDIANPTAGGKIDMLLDGTEGQVMMDNMTVNEDGTLVFQEDTGNAVHNGKGFKYDPTTDTLTQIYKSDVTRFGDVVGGVVTTGTLTKDEETSGVIDVTSILNRNDGKQYNLLVMQNHALSGDAETVEGGQLMLMAQPVPEPETYAMLLGGLGLMGFAAKRRRNKK